MSNSYFVPQPPTPNLEEDLKEVLRSEAGIELIVKDDSPPERRQKQVVSGRQIILLIRSSDQHFRIGVFLIFQ